MISPVGYILIPIALLLFFRGRRALLWVTVASIPFQLVQIADLGITTIKAFQVFGALFILRSILDGVWSGDMSFRASAPNVLGGIFILVCFFSLSMAAVKAGSVEVFGQEGGTWSNVYMSRSPLELSLQNFTQVLYPLWGFLLFYFLVREIREISDLNKSVNIVVWASVVLAGSSLAGGLLFTFGQGLSYVEFLSLFTVGPVNIGAPDVGSFGQFFRAYTLAGEPGDTAIYYLTSLGLLTGVTAGIHLGSTRGIRFMRAKLLFVVLAILVNGSTAAYFGSAVFVIWCLLLPIYFVRTKTVQFGSVSKVILGGTGVLIAAAVLEVGGESFLEWIQQYHIGKLQGEAGSGQIRLEVMQHDLEIFLQHPILGVGYGSSLSLSFGTFLISNLGILGTGLFFAFVFSVFRRASFVAKQSTSEVGIIAFSIALTLPPFMATLLVGMGAFSMNLGITWLVLAMAEASYQVYRKESTRTRVFA